MVKITKVGTTYVLTGKTYEFKEQIKQLGGKWDARDKVWKVPDGEGVLTQLKSFKITRSCGWCGEKGHFKPKCEKYREHRIKEIQERALQRVAKPGIYYKRFHSHPDCECCIEKKEYLEVGIIVDEPFTCWSCRNFCCRNASSCEIQKEFMSFESRNYRCPYHGTYQEKKHWEFMNDTSGT